MMYPHFPGNNPSKKLIFTTFFLIFGSFSFVLFAGTLPQAQAQTANSTTTALAAANASSSALQAQIDANNQVIAGLNQEIATYQAELQQVGANKKTLQAAIKSLDLQKSKVQTQISITQRQISTTQLEIQQLGGEINTAQQTIKSDQAALGAELIDLQKQTDQPLFMRVLSSGSISDAWDSINTNIQVQDAIQGKVQTLTDEKNSLTDSQLASQQKQQSLTSQQQSLVSTVQSKNQLLAETNSQEATYQKLLAQAQQELASFSTFAQNAGGTGLLGTQTVCDSWGCYYNQRDSAWGKDALNGTKYTLASDGCLISSMAMVLTHYGYKNVTPVTINSNPNNFAAYFPAYLLVTIHVNGATATRKLSGIDATLATGNPVIVGLNAYGGTHYVVLVSGSHGSYTMRDPYVQNGKDIPFTSHYSVREIFSAARVIVS